MFSHPEILRYGASRSLGFADDTRETFFEAARIAEAKRPAYLLLENVPGLLLHDGGRTLDARGAGRIFPLACGNAENLK